MTGRDPAVEAVRRAVVSTRGHGNPTVCEIAAAREMAKPIRELVEKWDKAYRSASPAPGHTPLWRFLDELAPLIYSDDELKDNQ